MTRIQSMLGAAILAAAVTAYVLARSLAEREFVTAGFWFDDVAFEMALPNSALVDPITESERLTIESLARSELESAYAGLRIRFADGADVRYSVRVVRRPPRSSRFGRYAGGESYSMGVLGGLGTVHFETLAGLALANAPPDADRRTIIEGIGRGIGRGAAHELAHQLLSGVNLHASTDRQSYEYRTIDRVAQFYGPIHWDFAEPFLVERLGSTN